MGSILASAIPCWAQREGAIGKVGAGAAWEGEAWLGAAAACDTDKAEGGPGCDAGKRETIPQPQSSGELQAPALVPEEGSRVPRRTNLAAAMSTFNEGTFPLIQECLIFI